MSSMSTENKNIVVGCGKKKSSIARVFIKQNSDQSFVLRKNKKLQLDLKSAFLPHLHKRIFTPLTALDLDSKLSVLCTVSGGGFNSQAEAIGHGIANAILKMYRETKDVIEYQRAKKVLRDLLYVTRDSRIVESKKAGLKKARRAEQHSKR